MSEESHRALIATIGSDDSDTLTPEVLPKPSNSVACSGIPQITRDAKGHFLPGNSPNPGGKSKLRTIREGLQAELDEGAYKMLARELVQLALADGRHLGKLNPSIQLSAIREVADRTEGKPIQSMIVQKQMDPEQMERLAELAERLAQVSR